MIVRRKGCEGCCYYPSVHGRSFGVGCDFAAYNECSRHAMLRSMLGESATEKEIRRLLKETPCRLYTPAGCINCFYAKKDGFDVTCIYDVRTGTSREEVLGEILGRNATAEDIKKAMDSNPCPLHKKDRGIRSSGDRNR